MQTRRSFIIGSAGLLTTAVLTRFTIALAKTGVAEFTSPKDYTQTLYVGGDGLNIALDCPNLEAWYTDQKLTYMQALRTSIGDPSTGTPTEDELAGAVRRWGVSEEGLHTDMKFYHKVEWFDGNNPETQAAEYLEALDLGPELDDNEDSEYGIEIEYMPNHGYDGPVVTALNVESAFLLQERLKELGEPTRVVLT